MSNPVTRTMQGKTNRVIFTHAQILALPTTGLEIVPAQGVGRGIIPICAILQTVLFADYTNINAAAELFVAETVNFGGLTTARETPDQMVTQVFGFGPGTRFNEFSIRQRIPSVVGTKMNQNFGWLSSDLDNLSVNIFFDNAGAGNLTGGNSANKLTVTLFYNVINLD